MAVALRAAIVEAQLCQCDVLCSIDVVIESLVLKKIANFCVAFQQILLDGQNNSFYYFIGKGLTVLQ